jgi:hypothetical protein
VEAPESFVRHSSALAKAADDVVFNAAHYRDVLGEHCQVIGAGCARQKRGTCGRERKAIAGRIHIDDSAGGHGAEPLAYVALVQSRFLRDLFRGRRRHRAHDVEQAGSMTD